MPFNYVLLEVHCLNGIGDDEVETAQEFCPKVHVPGFHCLEINCKHLGYT